MMTLYRSAFAVPSGFAVATRTAAKGKTTAVQDLAPKASTVAKGVGGRARPMPIAAKPTRAA